MEVRNELYHYGILGQKWGKRNGPPYPLSESKHSASEKKAGWKKSLKKNSETGSEADKVATTEKGKKIAKRILLSVGAVAVVGGVVMLASSSGSSGGADIYDSAIRKLAESLANKPFGGKLDQKHWDKHGRLVLPPDEYTTVMKEIKTHKDPRRRNNRMYPHYSAAYLGTYIVRKGRRGDPEVIDWFLTNEEAEAVWKELF